ncbi:MAG: DUF6431 domain-containing protein [Oscillospiraceae bacterium]
MDMHGRCKRYVRRHNGLRDELSLRVFYCSECHHYHRELPDFIVPYKHLCIEVIAAIYDALNNYDVEGNTVLRVRRWVESFLKFGAAMVRSLKLRHPILVTKYNADSTLETLKFFVRAAANANEWKLTSSCRLSGYSVL